MRTSAAEMLSSARLVRGQSGGLFFALKIAFVQRPARWGGSAGDAGQEFSRGGEGLGGAVEVSYGNTIG
jgi:hypothetical protein